MVSNLQVSDANETSTHQKKRKEERKLTARPFLLSCGATLPRHNAFDFILRLMSVFAGKNVQTHSDHLSECSKRLKL